ncbi:MAG: zinc-dependent metalloprotease [Acidimicrobiales bacterium]
MSNPSFGGGNPLEHLLGDLLKLISNAGPVQWDMARQLAHAVATDGQPEPNVDPLERIKLESLARVAELHVAEATGMSAALGGGLVTIRPVGRSEWASRTLDDWRPLLDSLAASLSQAPGSQTGRDQGAPGGPGRPDQGEGQGPPAGQEGTSGMGPGGMGPAGAGGGGLEGFGGGPGNLPGLGGLGDLLGSLGQVMGPAILGLQVGSALGHLSRRAMGPYVLPVPRPAADELLVVPANMASFAEDWSLPADEVRLWVCLNELTHHALLGRPHIRARLEELIGGYVGGFQPDTTGIEQRLAGVDPSDPESLQAALGDPTALLGELQTPAQRQLLAQLEAVVVAVEGYSDHVMDTVGHRLIQSYPSLTEALRRRRVERDEGERMVEQLFGLELGQDLYDRGAAFVGGVVERAGEEALGRLWDSVATLPTPAEVDAPGLWLARISLPEG